MKITSHARFYKVYRKKEHQGAFLRFSPAQVTCGADVDLELVMDGRVHTICLTRAEAIELTKNLTEHLADTKAEYRSMSKKQGVTLDTGHAED